VVAFLLGVSLVVNIVFIVALLVALRLIESLKTDTTQWNTDTFADGERIYKA
jgi:hypothetical protein|tara:strand:- start:470 stop:625 length:156 start_codon:yes stop_codon:yes gene_type:complete